MFSGKSVGKHAFFLLIDRIKGKEGRYTLYNIYINGRRGSWGWLDLWVLQVLQGVVGVAWCGGYCRVWWVLQELFIERKKNFFLFLPSHPHKCGSSALLIGVSRVRAGVRVELLPSHLPSHYPHTSGTGKYSVRGSVYRI